MLISEKIPIETLYQKQLAEWNLARENYEGLANVKVRTLPFKDYEIRLQCNPRRIRSSAAKIDPRSISERPCFLCGNNRPSEQEGIGYGDYLILVNPYPIFSRHLTIPSVEHVPQSIAGRFGDMLRLAVDMEAFIIVYNGPLSGASAPDHFHFQAVQRGSLPIETDFDARQKCIRQGMYNQVEVFTWDRYLRTPVTLTGSNPDQLEDCFYRLCKLMNDRFPTLDEPMMNVLVLSDKGQWRVHVFPRKLHRPRQYDAQGGEQLLLSPASIDMGGILVMPREEDYLKITAETVADIYGQVCADQGSVEEVVSNMLNR
jgi:hypothetical protein